MEPSIGHMLTLAPAEHMQRFIGHGRLLLDSTRARLKLYAVYEFQQLFGSFQIYKF